MTDMTLEGRISSVQIENANIPPGHDDIIEVSYHSFAKGVGAVMLPFVAYGMYDIAPYAVNLMWKIAGKLQ
jgi:hypothetical protein